MESNAEIAVVARPVQRESFVSNEIVIRFRSLPPKVGGPLAFGVSLETVESRASLATGIEPAIF
jgi:hypothetical protein